jgi:hypothetical protein
LDQDHKAVLVSPKGLVSTKWFQMPGETKEKHTELHIVVFWVTTVYYRWKQYMCLRTLTATYHTARFLYGKLQSSFPYCSWVTHIKLKGRMTEWQTRKGTIKAVMSYCKVTCRCLHGGMRREHTMRDLRFSQPCRRRFSVVGVKFLMFWWHYSPLKCRKLHADQHSVISQKNLILKEYTHE